MTSRTLARARFASRFYLGLGAPATRAAFRGCRVRAARGYTPELVDVLVRRYRHETDEGSVEPINFRCAVITPAGDERRFFVKEFPRGHVLHDVERVLRCSRVDRAWRAAHLLPEFGLLAPRAVGAAIAGEPSCEYLITEWLPEALPYHERLRLVTDRGRRLAMLAEFAGFLRRQHDLGLYLRDLVTNVLTRESASGQEYWLTDLDQLHPLRRVTRRRVVHQMRQLARWAGPLTPEETEAISTAYLGAGARLRVEIEQALLTDPAAR